MHVYCAQHASYTYTVLINCQHFLADIYEEDPVIFADFSNTPNTDTGLYKLVVNLSLPQDPSPYLVVGAPSVMVQWAQVPLDFACQPAHNYDKNTLALINTQVGGVRGDKWVGLEVVSGCGLMWGYVVGHLRCCCKSWLF